MGRSSRTSKTSVGSARTRAVQLYGTLRWPERSDDLLRRWPRVPGRCPGGSESPVSAAPVSCISRLPRAGRLLLLIISADCAVGLLAPHVFGQDLSKTLDGPDSLAALWCALVVFIAPVTVFAAWYVVRQQNRERAGAFHTFRLMDTVLHTSREWLWAVGPDGRFIFSGPACREMLGREPAELLGQHCSMVIDADDLTEAVRAWNETERRDALWSGLMAACRHKDGRSILVEVSGRTLRDKAGNIYGYEGTSRVLNPGAALEIAVEGVKTRISEALSGNNLITAFQPIQCIKTGRVLGVEALTRFVSPRGIAPEDWFRDAASVGLGTQLDMLAARNALAAAEKLPRELYVAINLAPATCLGPALSDLLNESQIATERILLEVTERAAVSDYGSLAAALNPLRSAGLRIAVDDAGAGFASMRHILQLKPDVIKLDRKIIAGIDTDSGQRALGAAMMSFAKEIGASVVAEGIETEGELAAVTHLGINAGQGYLLGRPTVRPQDWAEWIDRGCRKESSGFRQDLPKCSPIARVEG